MSNQRNADKDREIITSMDDYEVRISLSFEAWSHWLERAVSAEQRVAELETALRKVMVVTSESEAWTDGARAHYEAVKDLKGLESEDRGE